MNYPVKPTVPGIKIRECKHPTCGLTCRRPKKEKKFQFGRKQQLNNAAQANTSLSVPLLLKTAQNLFNLFIRLRDANKRCISCETGKVKDCGHFHPAGKFSGVRMDEINGNGQCDFCNRVLAGNLEGYHAGMITRYGAEAVKDLEERANATKMYKWTRSELNDLIAALSSKVEKFK